MLCSEHHKKHQQPDLGGSMGWHHTMKSCSHMTSGIAAPFSAASWRPSSLLTKVNRSFYIYIWLSSWISTICFCVMCHPGTAPPRRPPSLLHGRLIPPHWGTLAGSSNQARAASREHSYYPLWVLLEFVLWDAQTEVPLLTALRGNNCLVHASVLQRGWGRNMVLSMLVPTQHILGCPCHRSSPSWQHWL